MLSQNIAIGQHYLRSNTRWRAHRGKDDTLAAARPNQLSREVWDACEDSKDEPFLKLGGTNSATTLQSTAATHVFAAPSACGSISAATSAPRRGVSDPKSQPANIIACSDLDRVD